MALLAKDFLTAFNTSRDPEEWMKKVSQMQMQPLIVQPESYVSKPVGLRNCSDNLFPYSVRMGVDTVETVVLTLNECQKNITQMELIDHSTFRTSSMFSKDIDLKFDQEGYVEVDIDDADEAIGGRDREDVLLMNSGRWRCDDVYYEQKDGQWVVKTQDIDDEEDVYVALLLFDNQKMYYVDSQPPSLPGGKVGFQETSYSALNMRIIEQFNQPLFDAKKWGYTKMGSGRLFYIWLRGVRIDICQ